VREISDAVAIIAVTTSGIVAIGGIVATAYSASSQRRWQSIEERTTELRTVLDSAAGSLARAMHALVETERALHGAVGEDPKADEAYAGAHEWLGEAVAALKELWTATTRIQVRMGSASPVAQAAKDAEFKLDAVGKVLTRNVIRRLELPGYAEARAEAEAAERAFYDAAAAVLGFGVSP
jgi:hypothetical protein